MDTNEEKTTPKPQETPTVESVAISENDTVVVPDSSPEPVAAPKWVAPEDEKASTSTANSAGVVILQWLTYAFWGWTLIAFVFLAAIVFLGFFEKSVDVTEGMIYAVAATLVLLPLSIVCDVFYRRKEPVKKTGAAMAVMAIHAVIFALCGIGALIVVAFTLVQMLIGTDATRSGQLTALLTALASALLYALTFLRTLNPSVKVPIAKAFPLVMAAAVGLFIVLGFVGPVAQARLTKDDRDISMRISTVKSSVDSYVRKNKTLPASLNDVKISDERVRSLLDRGLITYKSDGMVLATSSKYDDEATSRVNYRYQLCAQFKEADTSNRSSYSYDYEEGNDTEDGYKSYLSTNNHPAGKVCYKLYETVVRDKGVDIQLYKE